MAGARLPLWNTAVDDEHSIALQDTVRDLCESTILGSESALRIQNMHGAVVGARFGKRKCTELGFACPADLSIESSVWGSLETPGERLDVVDFP